MRSTFADFFTDSEGAFANIILQNGLTSSLGFILSFTLLCGKESKYCVRFRDGSLHDVLSYEIGIVTVAILAILGYFRAERMHRDEAVRHQDYEEVPAGEYQQQEDGHLEDDHEE